MPTEPSQSRAAETDVAVNHERAAQIFAEHNAVLHDGHFVYTSGRHGSVYVNKDAVYPHTDAVRELCGMLAAAFTGLDVEVVCGPALGGVILSQWTAHHLGILGVYAEKGDDDGLVLRRGYDELVDARRVGVVEDILTTGGSLRATVAAVRAAGGDVVGTAALVNRGGVGARDVDAPSLTALMTVDATSWAPDECPLCAQGRAVDTYVGKGA